VTEQTVVTKEDIKQGLRRLGLGEGHIVGVHSSLSSFGWVKGGADAVIDALLETVGRTGSVVMPTYSTNREKVPLTPDEEASGITWKYRLLPFTPDKDSCWTGRIPDTFWRREEAIRSTHPTHSLAAIGRQANELVQGWHKVMEANGYILLLGVTLACCTAMHLAEERVQLPEFILKKLTPPEELRQKYPSPVTTLSWLVGSWKEESSWKQEWHIGFGPYPDFLLMEGPCQQRGIMKLDKIGEAIIRLIDLRELIDLYAEYLDKYPEVFYHGCVSEG